MASKRLVDAALVLNAARHVTRKHMQLRSEQYDVWTKTSTVARAAKSQTDRVTLTVNAASELAKRFRDEAAPPFDPQDIIGTRRHKQDQPDEDPHLNREPSNTEKGAPEVIQRVAEDVKATVSSPGPSAEQGHSPSQALPERNLSDGKESQEEGGHQQSKPQRVIPRDAVVPEQEELPEGVDTDVFHSPRVARSLGGRTIDPRLGLRGSTKTPLDRDVLSQGRDQDSFNVRLSTQNAPVGSTIQNISDKHRLEEDSRATVEREAEAKADEKNPQRENISAGIERDNSVEKLAAELSQDAGSIVAEQAERKPKYQMRQSRVPSSRVGRLWEYGGLATSMAFGAVGETFRRVTGSSGSGAGSLMLSAGNMERLVAKLSKMRGAALKLGQMMSFQDSKMLPEPIAEVLQRVQDNADYMPASQRNKVLNKNLGNDWKESFSSFEEVPFAAASIGQVHKGVLASSGLPVAIKIQYPGVAQSISSDLNNLSILLTASRLLPKGLFLDKTVANARTELAWECDYVREANCQERFRNLVADEDSIYTVPDTIPAACGPQVLTSQLMSGIAVTKPSLQLSQSERDWIGLHILRLCLRELTEFKFMQTDPNWTNFLYNRSTQKLELLDFGAARDFPDQFIVPYLQNLAAAARGDREEVQQRSIELGYLTGQESAAMRDAHVDSVLTIAEPFSSSNTGVYDFRGQTVTDRVRALIPLMVRERLSPPPEETYSLHRKLSGAFLLLARLGSRVHCRDIFVDSLHKWDPKLRC